MDFFFSYGGLILVIIFTLIAGLIRIKSCLDNKRNFITSSILSLGSLLINWAFVLSLFLGATYLGSYIKSVYYIPYYLQYAYFIVCAVGGMYLFSKFYMLGHKFFSNYRDKGKFSFNYKSNLWH